MPMRMKRFLEPIEEGAMVLARQAQVMVDIHLGPILNEDPDQGVAPHDADDTPRDGSHQTHSKSNQQSYEEFGANCRP